MAAKYPEGYEVLATVNGTGGALVAGDAIVCGDGIRILCEDLANGVTGPAFSRGKFTLNAESALAWADGAALFWKATEKELSNSSAGNTFAGHAAGAKTGGSATASVVLMGGAPTALPADSVTGAKIADDQIDSEHYVAASIDLEHMSVNSIDSDQYVDGSIDLIHMSANSVDSDQYVDGSVDAVHLAAFKGSSIAVAADDLVIPVTKEYVAKTTGADAEACTLANGVANQVVTISLVVDGGGDATVTPATKSAFLNFVLADAGDTVTVRYIDDTVGWVPIGAVGVAAPPVFAIS